MTDNTATTVQSANCAGTGNSQAVPFASRRIRWSWFPSLFFGDGILLSVIMLSVIMLRRFGLDNARTALYVSLLCVPFVLRPLFEMIVTHFRGTTKVWVLTSQFVSALSLWTIAFTIPAGYWLQATVCFMPFVVVSGIFYNVAAGRFYVDSRQGQDGCGRQLIVAMVFRGVAMLFGMGIVMMLAGNMEVVTRSVRYSWSTAFYVMAGVEFFLWLWHSIFLPGGIRPCAARKDLFGLHRSQYVGVVKNIVKNVDDRLALCFLALYALPEGMLAIVGPLFIVDAPHNGGLGLSPQEFGLVVGTVGVVALFLGHRIGIAVLARYGLRRLLLPMALVFAVHGVSMLFLSYNMAVALSIVCAAVFVGNMALGTGLSGWEGVARKFAIAGGGMTFRRSAAFALMSLTLVAVGAFSGLLQVNIGYRQYFTIALTLYAVSLVVAALFSLCTRCVQKSDSIS